MSKISTPDLCGQHHTEIKVLDPIFTNYGGLICFSGEVVTISPGNWTYADNNGTVMTTTKL